MSGMASGYSGAFQSYAEGELTQRINNMQANARLEEGRYQVEQARKQEKQLLGRQRVLYAKAGVDIGGGDEEKGWRGSPLEIMAATAGESYENRARIARSANEEAKMLRWYGKVAKKAGRMAFYSGMTSGTISGAESAVSYGLAGNSGSSMGSGKSSYGSGAMWSNNIVGSRGY